MKTKREILELFAEKGYCSSIECNECAYLGLCDNNILIRTRLQKIGAMAILRMFPEKKKPLLENGTKIKFNNGEIGQIIEFEDKYCLFIEKGNLHLDLSYLIGKTWEVVEEWIT